MDLGPPQRRAVLAALAVDAGRSVPVEVLIDRAQGTEPPDVPAAPCTRASPASGASPSAWTTQARDDYHFRPAHDRGRQAVALHDIG